MQICRRSREFTANSQTSAVTFRITLVKRLVRHALLLEDTVWVLKSSGEEL
jgi:hypothetical protein